MMFPTSRPGRFFHQVAPLLDQDHSISCINAFNSNSYPDTANDQRVMVRARSYPMYGWLTSRAYAQEILQKWVPLDVRLRNI